jgi:hypothetical protein
MSIGQLALEVVAVVGKRIRRSKLVAEALQGNRWIASISGSLSVDRRAGPILVHLRSRVQDDVQLNAMAEGKFIWKWSVKQLYSASSANRVFLLGECALLGAKEQCTTRSPPCKFFIWMVLLNWC